MLIDSQSARIAALKENIEILESTVEELEARDQEAAQLIEDLEAEDQEAAQLIEELEARDQEAAQLIEELEAKNEEIGQRVEDLQSESSEMEEMLNDLRCRFDIDIELVPGGCDWEPPESMPRQVGGWTLSKWEDEDTLSITYTVDGEGSDPQLQPSLRLYCIWDVNPLVLIAIDVGVSLHEAGEGIVNVDYRVGGVKRFEGPWRSWAGSGYTTITPEWEYDEVVLNDLLTGDGTLDLMITVDSRPPLQVVFEIDGIAEVFELLEPGCRSVNSALRSDTA